MVKFEEDLQSECLVNWENEYLDYKSLKSILVFEKEEINDMEIVSIFETFDHTVTSELEKINNFYKNIVSSISQEIEDLTLNGESQEITKNFNKLYDDIDNIRHYNLLNIVAVIKIIKKRNKILRSISDSKDYTIPISLADQKELLEKQDFYVSEELFLVYNKLKDKSIENYTSRLDTAFKKCEVLLTSLQDNQIDFDLNELLPGSKEQKWNLEEIQDYLRNKLGVTHQLEQIVDLNKIENRTNAILTRLGETANSEPATKTQTVQRSFIILFSLYAFLFGLDMMGSSFKALSGKNVGELFQQINNPIAGLIVGILVTVMLQSSSTTTSIIVSMVGADIVTTNQAIPLIMGANIGTSVTNTIVSHGHIHNVDEFKKAFSGATIHDIFNLMCVSIMLPFEIITDALGGAFLFSLSDIITTNVINLKGLKFKSPLKFIVAPLVKLFISIDKKVIAANAKGCVTCIVDTNTTTTSEGCWNLDNDECLEITEWNDKYIDGDVIKSGVFGELGDTAGGIISLIFSLTVLCIALYKIVKTLHTIVLQGRGRGRILDALVNVITKNGAMSILFGMLLTISVQSSSITTSTFTPLVGMSIISLEQMLPLTLGANLGTTCTALIASLVTESRNAVQIAVCHFLFNATGVALFYPLKSVRQLPIKGAQRLGNIVVNYKWFSVFYTTYVFVLVPLILLGISYLFNGQIIPSLFGSLCIGLLGVSSYKAFITLENRNKNQITSSNTDQEKIESNINTIVVSS